MTNYFFTVIIILQKNNIFYELYSRSEQGRNNFKSEKVIWSDIPGRDAKWKKNVIETELNGDVDRFEQEYECRFLGSSNSAFPIRVFEQLKLDIKEPIQTLFEGNLNIWELPQTNRVYTMGVDVAEGLGKDASVIQIFSFNIFIFNLPFLLLLLFFTRKNRNFVV